MAVTTIISENPPFAPAFQDSSSADRAVVVQDLLNFIEKQYKNGNSSVTQDKYDVVRKLRQAQQEKQKLEQKRNTSLLSPPPLPAPLYPPIFEKFALPKSSEPTTKGRRRPNFHKNKWTLKRVEATAIAILETVANILDNLHLLSKFPMFPTALSHVLKHTNRLWVLILVFLIRKTVSQLLNVIRKERKVNTELLILKSNLNSKLLDDSNEDNIFRKYEKVLRDLRFDKMMLNIELVGNFLDLAFNVIELYNFPVPEWFMTSLNFASMAMTVYRMNKDDEYVDDDITEDLI